MKKIIEFNNVWKKYSKNRIFQHSLQEDLLRIFNKNLKADLYTHEFWALKNINFYINEGEIIELIGPNGSGKSTILKLIANITYPNQGSIRITGKVAPIIELSSGFHQDLNGEENIFINGCMLGMTINEIKEKISTIIKFAEIQEFVHTPIKNYSSGMIMRLAFAIAVHSNADIFLFDEVLAVTDAQFQEKYYHQLLALIGQKKTVLTISHKERLPKELNARTISLNNGVIQTIEES